MSQVGRIPAPPGSRGGRADTRWLPHPTILLLAGGLVAGTSGCSEDVTAPAVLESTPTLATASHAPLSFRMVSPGSQHTCGVTTDDRAFCWGAKHAPGGSVTPVELPGALRFNVVSSGLERTCGITTNERAYCWDGIGTAGPVAVPGGRRFRQISVGDRHTCAVTPTDVAFCWGPNNAFGQLGTGLPASLTPTRVARGLKFRQVFASGSHTCGATTDNAAYCWGSNILGQLGDGTRTDGKKPVAVAGGLSFRQVMAGSGFVDRLTPEAPDVAFTCGVTTDNRAYCWGDNGGQQLGGTPVAVSGGHRFSVVDPGGLHTCGVALNGSSLCWGNNEQGQVGDGSFTNRSRPVPVTGGLRFNNVSTSVMGTTTCGVTTDNRAYCWGNNAQGQLGNGGVGLKSSTPVAVVGPT